jgi:CheY-like chemotaxis protein/anti-sigma regulatory factor (Ser/Thr protein kinase)
MDPPMERKEASASGGTALVVDDELSNRLILRALLAKLGYRVREAPDGEEAVDRFRGERPDVVFMDVMMPRMDGYEAAARIKRLSGDAFVPIIFLTALTDEQALARCVEAGGDDFLTKPFNHTLLRSKIQAMERIRQLHAELNRLYGRMRQDEEIAEQILASAVLADNVAMEQIPHRMQSADIFSGDLLLTARAPSGDLHLLLGDFTGHGLPATVGALPAAEAFRTMTAKGFSPEQILYAINRKLYSLLPTGLFMAALFVRLTRDLQSVQVYNFGFPEALLLDAPGGDIRQRAGSNLLALGILPQQELAGGVQNFAVAPGCRVLLASDGVTEAHDPDGALFGQARYEAAIAQSAGQERVLDSVNRALDAFCRDAPQRDDISLVELVVCPELFPAGSAASETATDLPPASRLGAADRDFNEQWRVGLNLSGERLARVDPVPLLINQIQELEGDALDNRRLYTVLTELYVNALDHGVVRLDSSMKGDSAGFVHYFAERERRLAVLDRGAICIGVRCEASGSGDRRLRIRVEDSGPGFEAVDTASGDAEALWHLYGRGLLLVRRLCVELTHLGRGNVTEAVFRLRP